MSKVIQEIKYSAGLMTQSQVVIVLLLLVLFLVTVGIAAHTTWFAGFTL